jgi:outer membrane protein assembly factor BamB
LLKLSKIINEKISLKRRKIFVIFLVCTFLLTSAFCLSFSDVQAQSERFKISGYVLDSNGCGIAKADVIFNVPSIVPGVFTDNSGYYETYGPSGTYHISVWPPFDSNYLNGDEAGFTVSSDITKNMTLQTGFKISGYVINSIGTPMVGASVLFKTSNRIYGSGYFTNSLGYYFINVPAGTYTIDAHPQTAFNPSYSGPCTPFPTYYEYNFAVNGNINKNIIVGGAQPTPTPTSTTMPTNESNPDDWPMFQHDLNHTGDSTSTASNGNLLWQFNTGDKVYSSPVIANGVIYEGSWKGYFYALNAATGSLIWQYNCGSQVQSTPAVANGIVYFGLMGGYVIALNADTGTLIWRFTTNNQIQSSPAVVNDVVYIGSFNGYIYALNATNGMLIWSYLAGGPIYSSPAIFNGILYEGSNDGNLYALNATKGTLIWSFNAGSIVYASPAIADNIVYVCSEYGALYALNASDGTKVWQANIGSGMDHADDSPAVANGIVYIGARNGYYAFNATDGSQVWFFTSPYSTRQLTGYVYSSPAVSGNVIYFGSIDSYVFALNAYNGSMIWSYRTGGFLFTSPAITNGVVYIGSYDGYIYALGASPASTTTLLPTSTPQPTATPSTEHTPTTTPTPAPTSQKTATPTQTPIPIQEPALLSETKPTNQPIRVESNRNEPINWIILSTIVAIAGIAIVTLYAVFKRGY